MRLGLVSLGCDKNTVDSERILATLVGHGAEPTQDLSTADIVLVNTCGFIDAAKEESIDALLDMARLKKLGQCKAVVAVGCLVERYRDELEPELPEVDLFIGLRDMDRLVPALQERGLIGDPLAAHPGGRLPLGEQRHVSYMKVSEGCNHGCAFCAIPIWRGRHRSFGLEALVAEAQRLEAQGTVELNLVAQDLAHYGSEIRDGTDAAVLLRHLLEETSIPWFRLLYIYSAGLREPLVDLIAGEDRVAPYIDMPIQHAADPVLERMRRPERRDGLRRKIAWLRDSIPDLTLRTTVLVGFPGETDEDFRALIEFMEEARFDRLGAFAFSPQPGTRAAEMGDMYVPDDVARERLEEVFAVQRAISEDSMAAQVGNVRSVLVQQAGEESVGRTMAQADDVDGVTFLHGRSDLAAGSIVEAVITGASDYDLEADVLAVRRDAPAGSSGQPLGRRRALPIASIGLEGGFGR